MWNLQTVALDTVGVGRRGEATEGWNFQKSSFKCQPRQPHYGLCSHSGPLFSEVSAILQAVHAPGQCGRDYTVSARPWGGLLGGKEKVSLTILTCLSVPIRFEKLAQDRKKQLEILQLAQAQGLDPPGHHFELKTFQTVRCQKPKGDSGSMQE